MALTINAGEKIIISYREKDGPRRFNVFATQADAETKITEIVAAGGEILHALVGRIVEVTTTTSLNDAA